jgi:hypothetical protein
VSVSVFVAMGNDETYFRNGWFARLVETIRFGMAGSGTLGPSSLKLGSGFPSMFVIHDMLVVVLQVLVSTCVG